MPCNPLDLTASPSNTSPAASIPGFGSPFSPKLPASFNTPSGIDDLNAIFSAINLILPSGTIKPALSANLGQNVFDGIMKVLDQFFPFLMLYKFFLPILNIVVCIIEVVCSIPNPFKLIRAINRLFRECIPEFLALFPVFALIIMIISVLLLLLSLIEYIVAEITKMISTFADNLNILSNAIKYGDNESILSITRKIGLFLCSFQNLFVSLGIFSAIIEIFQALLKSISKIPPCDDNSNDGCCTPDVCPAFIKNNDSFTETTGFLQYYYENAVDSGFSLPAGFSPITSVRRAESWQFTDDSLPKELAFINISKPYDLTGSNAVFFPSDSVINKNTAVSQAPYTLDIRLFYNPLIFGRFDSKGPRFVRIKDCIITSAPSTTLSDYQNNPVSHANGVLNIVGGTVYEDDGSTAFNLNGAIATLENFIHTPAVITSIATPLSPGDGYAFKNVEYTFKINHQVLLNKSLITLGCVPSVSLNKNFINTVIGGAAALNLQLLNNINFPDIGSAQNCISIATDELRANVSVDGLATFQSSVSTCLSILSNDTAAAIKNIVGIGFDQYKSTFQIDPVSQFTSKKIKISVQLKETSGSSLLSGSVPSSISDDIGKRISAIATFGAVEDFIYDQNGSFISYISSKDGGAGTLKISFDNKVISDIIIPTDIAVNPTISERSVNYNFVFSQVLNAPGNSDGDTFGKPQRTNGDV